MREWSRTRPTAIAPALTAQHLFNGLHTRIRHERMIIPRSSEKFWGTNAGTDNANYGVPLVLERRGYAKEPSQYRNNPARPAAVGIYVPDWAKKIISLTSLRLRSPQRQPLLVDRIDRGRSPPAYNQSLSSFSDAARIWYYVSSPMFTSR